MGNNIKDFTDEELQRMWVALYGIQAFVAGICLTILGEVIYFNTEYFIGGCSVGTLIMIILFSRNIRKQIQKEIDVREENELILPEKVE